MARRPATSQNRNGYDLSYAPVNPPPTPAAPTWWRSPARPGGQARMPRSSFGRGDELQAGDNRGHEFLRGAHRGYDECIFGGTRHFAIIELGVGEHRGKKKPVPSGEPSHIQVVRDIVVPVMTGLPVCSAVLGEQGSSIGSGPASSLRAGPAGGQLQVHPGLGDPAERGQARLQAARFR